MADTVGSNPTALKGACRFDSCPRYHFRKETMNVQEFFEELCWSLSEGPLSAWKRIEHEHNEYYHANANVTLNAWFSPITEDKVNFFRLSLGEKVMESFILPEHPKFRELEAAFLVFSKRLNMEYSEQQLAELDSSLAEFRGFRGE